MNNSNIAIIGGGNLGAAIAEGLIKSKFVSADKITITRRNLEALNELKKAGANVTSDNAKAIQNNDVIIVALKPYNVKEVLESLKQNFDSKKQSLVCVPINWNCETIRGESLSVPSMLATRFFCSGKLR